MNLNIGFVKATSERMIKCLSAFQRWVVEHAQLPFDQLAADPQGLSWTLRAYGLYLFEHGLPRYLLVYSITACQDVYPACKPYMNIAWQIDRKWQLHEPGSCRAVLPAVIVRAMACVGALWNWLSWTAVFLLGFAGMLHPSEMLSLVRKDLVFPSDLNHETGALYLRVRDPKTARFARRQHSRIDDESIIQIAEAAFGKLPLESRLYAVLTLSDDSGMLFFSGFRFHFDKRTTEPRQVCFVAQAPLGTTVPLKTCLGLHGGVDGLVKRLWNFIYKKLDRRCLSTS